MSNISDDQSIVNLLRQHKQRIARNYVFPGAKNAGSDAASANSFLLGASIDYRVSANTAWRSAKALSEMLGADHVWCQICSMSEAAFLALRRPDGRYFHRFWQADGQRSIARRLMRIACNMVEHFGGDACNIWKGATASEVKRRLMYEVQINITRSDAIPNMIVGALIEAKVISGSSNVKADMHVTKVLGRVCLGRVATQTEAVSLARQLVGTNPFEVDLALFNIGQSYCHRNRTDCHDCPMLLVCAYANNR